MGAKNIYVVDASAVKFRNIHQLIRTGFGARDGESLPSVEHDGRYFVLSGRPPIDVPIARVSPVRLPPEAAVAVAIEAVVAFDKNLRCLGSADDRQAYVNGHYMTPEEALEKFAALAGLDPVEGEAEAEFMGAMRSWANAAGKSFPILNRFRVGGLFRIADREKLSRALTGGVGNRANYGHGLVTARAFL